MVNLDDIRKQSQALDAVKRIITVLKNNGLIKGTGYVQLLKDIEKRVSLIFKILKKKRPEYIPKYCDLFGKKDPKTIDNIIYFFETILKYYLRYKENVKIDAWETKFINKHISFLKKYIKNLN